DRDIFCKIIKCAIQAPSGDNLQPWIIKPKSNFNSFDLSLETEKDDFFDVDNTASFISTGTFLENLKIAALEEGFKTEIKFIDNDINSLNIAEIKFEKTEINKKNNKNELYKYIFKRATIRGNYSKKNLEKEFFKEIEEVFKNEKNCKISFFQKNKKLQKILFKADLIRLITKKAQETLYHNVRWNKKEVEKTRTGLDYRTLGIPAFPKLTLKLLSSWPFEKFIYYTKLNYLIADGAINKPLNNSEGIGILSINNYSKLDFIKAGMKLENIWLHLSKYDAYLQPFATITFFIRIIEKKNGDGFNEKQIEKLKKLKNELIEETKLPKNEELVMIFRYGKAEKPKIRTIRKNVEDFIKY
ncbi:MAG: hypothetical protein KC550_04400, partial [Nanoarchaeota archaeon]|nr:hypothetical protein [Nanoarchaeota archaeon]